MTILKKNIAANFAGNAWQALMGLVFVPIYIKLMGIEAYSLIGIFAVMQAWLTILDMGMTPTLSREMARFAGGVHKAQFIRDLLRSIEIIGYSIAIVIILLIWAGSKWLAYDWLKPEKLSVGVVAQAITIMGVVTALRFIENIYRSSIAGLQRQVLLNIVLSIMITLRSLGAVGILIWVSPTIKAFFVWQGILSFISVGIFSAILYNMLPIAENVAGFSLTALKGIQRFAVGMMTITFLALLLTQIDKILLSRLLPLETFGYYALAGSVTNALYMFPGPVMVAFYPRFTELIVRGDEAALVDAYHKSAQLVTVLMGSAAIMLIIFGDIVIMLWTADATIAKQVAPLVAIMALGTLLNGLMWIPYQTQLSYGWTSLTVKVNIIAVTVIVPAILWATPKYGAIGAAWVWAGLNAGYVTIAIYFMHRRLLPTEKWRWYRQDVAMPLITGAVVAVMLRRGIPSFSDALAQLIVLLISAILVLASAVLSAPAVRQQLVRYLQQRIKAFSIRSV